VAIWVDILYYTKSHLKNVVFICCVLLGV